MRPAIAEPLNKAATMRPAIGDDLRYSRANRRTVQQSCTSSAALTYVQRFRADARINTVQEIVLSA